MLRGLEDIWDMGTHIDVHMYKGIFGILGDTDTLAYMQACTKELEHTRVCKTHSHTCTKGLWHTGEHSHKHAHMDTHKCKRVLGNISGHLNGWSR